MPIRPTQKRAIRGLSPGSEIRAVRLATESQLVALGVLLYFIVRGLVYARPEQAFANAERVISLEERAGLFRESSLQAWVLDRPILGTFANWIYIWGHWPVIVGTLFWLATRHPASYPLFRNALMLSGAMGFIFFVFFPVAPPRFFDSLGFVDTITLQSSSYRVLQPPSLANPYAALPSFHFGWNLLMGIAIVQCAKSRWIRMTGVLLPVAMFWAIVATANHFVVDGILGGLLVLLSLWLLRGPLAQAKAFIRAILTSQPDPWSHTLR